MNLVETATTSPLVPPPAHPVDPRPQPATLRGADERSATLLASPPPPPPGCSRDARHRPPNVPVYRVHKAKDLGYVRLGGRMIYLGRANTSQSLDRYRRTVAEWLVTGRARPCAGDDSRSGGPTVAAVAEAYLRWAKAYYSDPNGRPGPGLGPVAAASKPLCALYGSVAAASFGPVALRAVRQVMVDSGLCRNVVNQRLACVKRIFRWAVAEELVPPSVTAALGAVGPLRRGRSGARETEPVRPVPDAQVDAVLPFLPSTLAAMVRLQRLTGMRSGELCVLRTRDVDQSEEVWRYRPPSHKTAYRGHGRVVCLGPRAQAVLTPFLRPGQPEAYVFSPRLAQLERRMRGRACGEAARAIVVASPVDAVGVRYQPRSYRRALHYAMRAATRAGKLNRDEYWHPHQLRHRHATQVRRVHGLEGARVLLGHRSVDQTLEYAEADSALAATLAREIG